MTNLEIGVMFWAGEDPVETIRNQKALGVNCGQVGVAGNFPLEGAAGRWRKAMADEGFRIVTVFCAYTGEDYADVPTVERTVGFMPPATRAERERRTLEISDFAAAIGVKSIACHVGFVPEDTNDPEYKAVRDLVRRVADHAAKNGQTFALETGQEPADALLKFLIDVDRKNVGINFDPANMILYGTGDPIEALSILGPHVISVHAKDGEWPPKDVANALGTEQPLGQGAVGMEQFINKLKQVGYKGVVNVEREVEDVERKKADMRMGVELLKTLI
ncbi:MAG TPA: sugar phosphate isomerase/epimerase family protein [Bryobacteraceae bacterium]|nr:sugar phosphate isomerase/epimerase family protein [Bryobacteraceae bacterium]